MKNFRLAIQLILFTFLIGKGVTTVIGLEISGLEAVWVTAPVDSAEEPSGEDDATEEDDEALNGSHFTHASLLPALFNATFYFRTPLESQLEIIVPPPQV